MMNLSIGIDVGASFCVIYAFSEVGEVVVDGKELETFDLKSWHDLLKPLAKEFKVRACFLVGPHYEWLYDLLMEYCREVEVINPADFAVISKSQRKTDKIDARKLAEGLCRGDLPSVYVPDKLVREDRRLVSFTHKLSQDLNKLKGQIRSLLTPHRLRCPYSDVLGLSGRHWLEKKAMSQLDEQAQVFLAMLLERADVMVEHRSRVDKMVSERSARYAEARYIRSIPGFGPLTTLAVMSAVAEVSRFDKPGQLSSYFGVCGSVHQSGKINWKGPMTKRGNVHVRWLLSQSLKHLHQKDPKAYRRYRRLKRGKPTGVARGAQMRWLTEIIWRLLQKREYYRPGKKAALL